MTENRAVDIAKRFGLWLKVSETWYTPDRFAFAFGNTILDINVKRTIIFANPDDELTRGHHMIIKWVRDKEDPENIVSALIKMFNFQKDVCRFYTPVNWSPDMNNKDSVIQEYYNSDESDRIMAIYREPPDIGR